MGKKAIDSYRRGAASVAVFLVFVVVCLMHFADGQIDHVGIDAITTADEVTPEELEIDTMCRAAWAEQRRRFLGLPGDDPEKE